MDPHLHNFNPTQPQPGPGLRRLVMAYITARNVKVTAGALLALGFVEVTAKDSFKPTSLFGDMIGNVWSHEQNAARPASVTTAKQIADANAEAQAKAQQQVILGQTAQQYGFLTALPSIFGSWWFSGKCIVGMENRDPAARADCHKAQGFNAAVNQQPLNSAYGVGPTSMFGNPPQGGGATQATANDAAPLSQGEYNRMSRLESFLDPAEVAKAQGQFDRSTNRGERRYLGKLATMAGEAGDDNGPSGQPRVIYHPEAPQPRVIPPTSILNR